MTATNLTSHEVSITASVEKQSSRQRRMPQRRNSATERTATSSWLRLAGSRTFFIHLCRLNAKEGVVISVVVSLYSRCVQHSHTEEIEQNRDIDGALNSEKTRVGAHGLDGRRFVKLIVFR